MFNSVLSLSTSIYDIYNVELFMQFKVKLNSTIVDFFAPSSFTPLPGGDQALNLWGVVRVGGSKSSSPLFLDPVSTVDAPHIIGPFWGLGLIYRYPS